MVVYRSFPQQLADNVVPSMVEMLLPHVPMHPLYFVAHVPGKTPKVTRVFPPPMKRIRPGAQFSGLVPRPVQPEEAEPVRDARGTGTPDTVAPAPRHAPPPGTEAALTEHVVPPAGDVPAEDDWIYDIEPPR